MTDRSLSVGRIVHYRFDSRDVTDTFLLVGNKTQADTGAVFPAVVVRCDSDGADLQVFIDGPGLLWRPRITETTTDTPEPGHWFWPPRV